jgi:protein-disulfide isomerase
MTITKYYEIVCDFCGCAITHSVADSKKDAENEMVQDGGIKYKGKHFCNNECKSSLRTK